MRKYKILCLVLCLAFSLGVSPAAASGEASGASGEVNADDESVILPEAVTLDELILGAGDSYEFTGDTHVGHLEIGPGAQVSCQYPVIVTFESSDSVENGRTDGYVQFVSDYDEVIAIVHTNDVHGHIEVEPYVKGLADALKASGDYSLVLTVSGRVQRGVHPRDHGSDLRRDRTGQQRLRRRRRDSAQFAPFQPV